MELGTKAKDMITGFEGYVTGLVDYLTGCSQALLVPRMKKDGTLPEGQWFDVQRLETLSARRIRLDNGVTPGSDRAPSRNY